MTQKQAGMHTPTHRLIISSPKGMHGKNQQTLFFKSHQLAGLNILSIKFPSASNANLETAPFLRVTYFLQSSATHGLVEQYVKNYEIPQRTNIYNVQSSTTVVMAMRQIGMGKHPQAS